jgi:general secretion pathway protein D
LASPAILVGLAGPALVGAQEAAGDAVRLDFQNVELGVVVSALADAGGLNLIYSDLPNRLVTLRMNQPVPRDQVQGLLANLALSNGFRLVEDETVLRLEAIGPAEGGPTEPGADSALVAELRLFVYRLKHAKAARLASTLRAMFGGRRPNAQEGRTIGRRSLSEQLRGQELQPVDPDAPPGEPAVDVELVPQEESGLPGELESDVLIVPDEATNSLLVRAAPGDWEILRTTIEQLDLRPLQVLIEVLIIEVRRTDDFSLGLTGEADGEIDDETTIGGALSGFTTGDFALDLMRTGGTNVTAMLSALSRDGRIRIVSRPVVVAQNNQEARILIGEERPFVQVFRTLPTDAGVRDQVVQFRDVGTTLSIIPTINSDGYVNLLMLQEVSSATEELQFGAPVISTREASTQLFVRDGQTVVIGGLIDHQRQFNRSGVPLLKDIPVLGFLFGSTQSSVLQNELFIFLTPHIIESDADAEALREHMEESTEYLRDEIPEHPELRVPPDTARAADGAAGDTVDAEPRDTDDAEPRGSP